LGSFLEGTDKEKKKKKLLPLTILATLRCGGYGVIVRNDKQGL
jgi:hypothetical protein